MNASDDWSCHCGKRFATLREVNQHQRKCFPKVALYRSSPPKEAKLRAQVKDLKARIQFVRNSRGLFIGRDAMRALNLRVRVWRKP